MALDTDIDDQDQAETFDEDATGGDGDLETSYPLDRDRSVRDFTHAKGDEDGDDEDEALDADEESDELLDDLNDDEEEDDLDDDDSDDDQLAVDNVRDFTSDADFSAPEGEAEVSAHADDEADVRSMGDMTNYDSTTRASDFESDDLSDSDLEELDYAPARADADKPSGDSASGDDAAPKAEELAVKSSPTARHDDKRLDEGLEETFPASDPVSAKHIT